MHGFGYGFGTFPMIFMWLFWVAVVVAVVVLIVKLVTGSGGSGDAKRGQSEMPEEILKQRYARGEVSKEDYDRMLADLRK